MCGFFAFAPRMSASSLADMLDVSNLPSSLDEIKSLKFHPKIQIPTVSHNSPNQLVMRHWSLVPRWWKKDIGELNFSTFNARAEDISQKPTYRTPWKKGQRCLVPSTWFYEFEKVAKTNSKLKKVPYRVGVNGEEVFTMAGLYENWQDKQGKDIKSVTIITCRAVPPLSQIHHRQPVIIKTEDRTKWLDQETSMIEVNELLSPELSLKLQKLDKLK